VADKRQGRLHRCHSRPPLGKSSHHAERTTVEFRFSIASTCTYLSVTRLSAVERKRAWRLVWRPFSVRTIMNEQNNSPVRDKPSFIVDREVFWGDNRLDDALAWARFGTLRPAVSG
jgi:2-hydroxychromene-2-carboxylate isomerase